MASDVDPALDDGGDEGGGVVGLSSDKEGPDPSRSSVEKTLSYAASRVFVDWPVLWGMTRDEGPVAGGGTAVGVVFELGLEADRQLGR